MDSKLDEQTLADHVAELKSTLGKLPKILNEAADAVNRIRTAIGSDLAEAYLQVQAGLSPEDTSFFGGLGELFSKHGKLNAGVSPEALRLLMTSASDAVQADALRMINAGVPIGKAKLELIRSHQSWIEKGDEQTEQDARLAFLGSAARKNFSTLLRELETRADHLHYAVSEFSIDFVPRYIDEDPHVMRTDREGYEEAYAEVSALAVAALNHFELLFGDARALSAESRKDSHTLRLRNAHRALTRLSAGVFGHKGGFAFDIKQADLQSYEMIDALAYICTQPSEDKASDQRSLGSPDLRVLEIGAGAGGQALGLMSAGFRHVALYERILKRAKTLKTNWPAWNVISDDIRAVTDAELFLHHSVDLLAAGISSAMTSRQSGKEKRGDEDDLIPELLRAVRVIEPRAIMIESAKEFNLTSHVAYLASFKAAIASEGYTVESFALNLKSYGLPREDERILIVAIRHGERGTFIPPILRTELKRNIGEALGDLVVRHLTPVRKLPPDMESKERHYNEWAATWGRIARANFIKTIPREWVNSNKDCDGKKKTHQVFDAAGYADEPFQLEDFKVGGNYDRLPKLTERVIARAQGFPDAWVFEGIRDGNINMIADALPPILAKAVALQIKSALTGATYDLDAALAEPIIEEWRIGKLPRRLFRSTRPPEMGNQIEQLIEADVEISKEKNVKKRQALFRKELANIEANPKKRTALVKAMRIEQALRDSVDRDEEWMDESSF